MPWYKSGTVSVALNSNAVIGTGTAFIANGRVGDGFRGPDGGWYEVTNIVSDTAMSISPPFQGATNASGSYALAPLQGYVKDSADTLRALVNTYGAKLAALGTTGNYDVLPPSKGGTGITDLAPFAQGLLNDTDAAGARSTLVAAKSGANSDITSLAGLTTALSVSQGGTGGTSQSAARTGLGLGSAAVAPMVGTVSQSGGSPTGAIIERGSNAAGEFTKYADGTIVLSGRMSLAGLTWTTGVGVRYASSPNVSIPAPIVSGRIAFHTNNGDVSGLSAYVAAATLGTSAITNIYYAAPSGTSGSAVPTTDYVIHGRWF